MLTFPFFKKRFYSFIYFGERERGEKERERNINVWLLFASPLLGIWPATQACALTGNRTDDPLVGRPTLNPQSHTSQGEHSRFSYGKTDEQSKAIHRLFELGSLASKPELLIIMITIKNAEIREYRARHQEYEPRVKVTRSLVGDS